MADPCGNCGHSKESHDSQGCVMCMALNRANVPMSGCSCYRPPGPQDQDPRDTQLKDLGSRLALAMMALDLGLSSRVREHLSEAIKLHSLISK